MQLLACFFVSLMLLLTTSAAGQTQQEQVPPGLIQAQKSAQQARAQMPPPASPRPNTVSPEELKRDADELLALAQQVPAEIQDLNHGILDKGLETKLKQIEKLSKRLREQVRR